MPKRFLITRILVIFTVEVKLIINTYDYDN